MEEFSWQDHFSNKIKNRIVSWRFIRSSLNKNSFTTNLFLFRQKSDFQEVFLADLSFPSNQQIRIVMTWPFNLQKDNKHIWLTNKIFHENVIFLSYTLQPKSFQD